MADSDARRSALLPREGAAGVAYPKEEIMNAKTVAAALFLALAGCNEAASDHEGRGAYQESDALGTLSLPLVSADSSGRLHRLRSAVFGVQRRSYDQWPPQDAGAGIVLSSESDLEAGQINAKLAPGIYDVMLSDGWHIERLADGSWNRVAQTVLLSEAHQTTYVSDRGVSSVEFRFGVDGQLVDFRAGHLQIGISIEQPGEGAPDAGSTGGTGGFGGTTGGGGFTGGAAF
ncbi:MAG TPA: hypothetical protein VFZ61_20935 [Polyangiales bacterium]